MDVLEFSGHGIGRTVNALCDDVAGANTLTKILVNTPYSCCTFGCTWRLGSAIPSMTTRIVHLCQRTWITCSSRPVGRGPLMRSAGTRMSLLLPELISMSVSKGLRIRQNIDLGWLGNGQGCKSSRFLIPTSSRPHACLNRKTQAASPNKLSVDSHEKQLWPKTVVAAATRPWTDCAAVTIAATFLDACCRRQPQRPPTTWESS